MVMCLERLVGIRPVRFKRRPWQYVLRVPIAFLVFAAGACMFRAPDLHVAGAVYRQMFSGVAGAPLLNVWQIGLASIALVLAILGERLGWFGRVAAGPLWAYGGALAILFAALELFSVTEISVRFIYFQFRFRAAGGQIGDAAGAPVFVDVLDRLDEVRLPEDDVAALGDFQPRPLK